MLLPCLRPLLGRTTPIPVIMRESQSRRAGHRHAFLTQIPGAMHLGLISYLLHGRTGTAKDTKDLSTHIQDFLLIHVSHRHSSHTPKPLSSFSKHYLLLCEEHRCILEAIDFLWKVPALFQELGVLNKSMQKTPALGSRHHGGDNKSHM
ncbi:uncharacterized protein RBU33_026838 isoform 1-T1 [Hipposideros larvatus]